MAEIKDEITEIPLKQVDLDPETLSLLNQIDQNEAQNQKAASSQEVSDLKLKKLLLSYYDPNTKKLRISTNKIWGDNFPSSDTATRAKLYRAWNKLKREGVEDKKESPSSKVFKPILKPSTPIKGTSTDSILTEAEPSAEEIYFVSTKQAEYLMTAFDHILKMIDPRVGLSEQLKQDGAELHRDILNAYPSVINKITPFVALGALYGRISIETYLKLKYIKAQEQAAADKKVKDKEKQVENHMKAHGKTPTKEVLENDDH